jgi:hypothetical protein
MSILRCIFFSEGKEEVKAMEDRPYPIAVFCPWCEKGKTLADAPTAVAVLCQCRVCGNYYRANFQTRRAARARAAPKKK